MRRAGWIVLVVLSSSAVGVWADCGCGPDPDPACYETFRSNEIIGFSLVVPVDYFWCYETSVTPLITGWRVETLEGVVVEHVTFTEPRGHWESFAWDVTDTLGPVEASMFYRIVVETTSVGEAGADVEIIPCRVSPCCWGCCSPTVYCRPPTPCCSTPYGELYLVLTSAGTRRCGCATCTVEIFGHFESSAP